MIRALALLLALASPASATQHDWPALYKVIGVTDGDVLNVRSAPNLDGDILTTLTPDAVDIEVIRSSDDLTWGLVNSGEGTGWVSLTYLARQPVDPAFPAIRQCFGTEPFWSLAMESPNITLSKVDVPRASGIVSSLHASRSRTDRYFFKGALLSDDAGPLEVSLSIRMQACSDGMSDRAYGIELDMLVSDTDTTDGFRQSGLFSGCCSLQPPTN